jgi:hypothetical protein
MQSALLILIDLGSVVKAIVLWRFIAAGIWKRHVCFCAMVALSLARSVITANGKLHPIEEFWRATTWPTTILQAAAAIEAFWGLARHFRGIRNFGWALLGVILIVAAAAAATLGLMKTHWNSPLRAPLLVDQYTSLWLVFTAMLSLAFFKQFPKVPVRPNAIHHLAALTALFASNFVGYSIGQLSHGELRFLTNLVIACGVLSAYTWWALKITRDGERLPFAVPSALTKQEFEAAEAAHRQSTRELKQAGSEALRRMFRS